MPAKRERTWTLISVMALSGVVKVDCVIGAERSRREKGSRWRRGEERSHAGLPTPFYNRTTLNGNLETRISST